jgi:hypothetical protein
VGRTVNLSRSDSIGDNRWIPVIPAKRSVNRTSRVVFAGVGGSRQARAARFIVATILLFYWIIGPSATICRDCTG